MIPAITTTTPRHSRRLPMSDDPEITSKISQMPGGRYQGTVIYKHQGQVLATLGQEHTYPRIETWVELTVKLHGLHQKLSAPDAHQRKVLALS